MTTLEPGASVVIFTQGFADRPGGAMPIGRWLGSGWLVAERSGKTAGVNEAIQRGTSKRRPLD